MTFTDICKALAAIVLCLSLLGGLFVADSASKKYEFSYDYKGDLQEKEVQDGVAFTVALLTTWISGAVFAVFVFGIGEIVEELRRGNTYRLKILDSLEDKKEDSE